MEGESSTVLDLRHILNKFPQALKQLSLEEEERSPVCIYYPELQCKESDRDNYKLQNLMLPETRKKEGSTTIEGKICERYIKSCVKNTLIEKEKFIKTDFLKELVLRETLKHVILEMYPKRVYKYVFDTVRVPADIKGAYFDNIQSETLSFHLFENLRESMKKCSIDIMNFMYDYNIILEIKKYLSNVPGTEPIFSQFILLKPNNMLLIKLAEEELEEKYRNNTNKRRRLVPDLNSLEKQSKVFSKASGPLYLETNLLAKQFLNFLRDQQNQFDPYTSQVFIEDSENQCPDDDILQSFHMISASMHRFHKCLNSPMGLPFQISGTQISYEKSWKNEIMEFLTGRTIKEVVKNPLRNPLNKCEIVELFTVKFSIYSANNEILPTAFHIVVFRHLDGSFQYCLSARLLACYIPRFPDALFVKEQHKESLDRYILEAISLMHQSSTRGVHVKHSNFSNSNITNMYTGDKEIIKKRNKRMTPSSCCVHNSVLGVHKKYLAAAGYKEFSNLVNLPIRIGDTITNYLAKPLNPPYFIDICKQVAEVEDSGSSEGAIVAEKVLTPYQVMTKIPEFSIGQSIDSLGAIPQLRTENEVVLVGDGFKQKNRSEFEAHKVIQNGHLRTAFEAHKFEKSESYPLITYRENGEHIKTEVYPSLFQKYEYREIDFMDGYSLTFTDDMRYFLRHCSKGRLRPTYLNCET